MEGIRIYLYLEKKEKKTKELGWDKLRCKLNGPLSASDERIMGTGGKQWVGVPRLVAVALMSTVVG